MPRILSNYEIAAIKEAYEIADLFDVANKDLAVSWRTLARSLENINATANEQLSEFDTSTINFAVATKVGEDTAHSAAEDIQAVSDEIMYVLGETPESAGASTSAADSGQFDDLFRKAYEKETKKAEQIRSGIIPPEFTPPKPGPPMEYPQEMPAYPRDASTIFGGHMPTTSVSSSSTSSFDGFGGSYGGTWGNTQMDK